MKENSEVPAPIAEPVNEAAIASLSDNMDDMEIAPVSRRKNRKRNFIESQDSDAGMELEVSETQQKVSGAMDRFVTKSAEHSQPVAPAKVNPSAEKRKRGMKRVKKERTYTNDEGYMVVEEYSSYEEADPNELKQ